MKKNKLKGEEIKREKGEKANKKGERKNGKISHFPQKYKMFCLHNPQIWTSCETNRTICHEKNYFLEGREEN